MPTKLAFVTYETPFAPAGGIAAVMGRLPRYVLKASGIDTVVITPFHHKIERTTSLPTEDKGQAKVIFNNEPLTIKLRLYEKDIPWYFLQAEQPIFFAGTPHPYLVGNTRQSIGQNLLRDSLVFGQAVVKALEIVDPEADWILMLQDWGAATTVLALSNYQHRCKLFLTLHNSYDSPATDDDLTRHGILPESCPGTTILNRAIPLLERTVFTVSDQFALDLTEDEFQARVMAEHLKDLLQPRLLGVNNGLFVDLAVDPNDLIKASRGNFKPLAKWKAENREQALDALQDCKKSSDKPVWGNINKFNSKFNADPLVCWFVMAGRDDTRQKGYDIATLAVEGFLQNGGKAQFFFFPIPGDEGHPGLQFLKDLAERFPESVIVFPFLWKEGFLATLRGASFGLMPSFYEPFGMANEFYLNGTIGIGRATGGIIQQIVPLQGISCFSHAAQIRSARWHSSSANPTGLLFREPDNMASSESDWRGINMAAYRIDGEFPNRLQERRGVKGNKNYKGYPLFRSISNELRNSLLDAVRLYNGNPNLYYRMLIEGVSFIQRGFSWERAAQEYIRNAVSP